MITLQHLRQLLEYGTYTNREKGITNRIGSGKVKAGITVHSGDKGTGYSTGSGRSGKFTIYQTITQKTGHGYRRSRKALKLGSSHKEKAHKLFKTKKFSTKEKQ